MKTFIKNITAVPLSFRSSFPQCVSGNPLGLALFGVGFRPKYYRNDGAMVLTVFMSLFTMNEITSVPPKDCVFGTNVNGTAVKKHAFVWSRCNALRMDVSFAVKLLNHFNMFNPLF